MNLKTFRKLNSSFVLAGVLTLAAPSGHAAVLTFSDAGGGQTAVTLSGQGNWSNPTASNMLVTESTATVANWFTVAGPATGVSGSFDFGFGITTTAPAAQMFVGQPATQADDVILQLSGAPIDGAPYFGSGTMIFDQPFSNFSFPTPAVFSLLASPNAAFPDQLIIAEAAVPEPSTMVLLLLGVPTIGWRLRRRRY